MSTLNIPKLNLALQEQDLKNAPSQEQIGEVIVEESFQAEDQVKQNFKQEVQLEQPGSLKRKQMSAIASFFDQPVSIGALAGQALAGIFGGSQAGAAATPIAMEFNKLAASGFEARRNRESQELRASVKAGSANNFSNSASYTDKDGNSVIFDKKSGKYFYPGTNEEVNGKEVRNNTFFESVRKKDQGDQRIDISRANTELRSKALGLAVDKFGFTKEEAAEITPEQFKVVSAAAEGIEQFKELAKLAKPQNVGLVLGRAKNVKEVLALNDPEFTSLKQKVGIALAGYQKAISGVAVGEKEASRLQALMPKVTDSWAQFQTKAKGFEEELERRARIQLNLAKTTQGRGEGFDKEIKKLEAANNPSAQQTASEETIIMLDPNGNQVRVKKSQIRKAIQNKYRRAK